MTVYPVPRSKDLCFGARGTLQLILNLISNTFSSISIGEMIRIIFQSIIFKSNYFECRSFLDARCNLICLLYTLCLRSKNFSFTIAVKHSFLINFKNSRSRSTERNSMNVTSTFGMNSNQKLT